VISANPRLDNYAITKSGTYTFTCTSKTQLGCTVGAPLAMLAPTPTPGPINTQTDVNNCGAIGAKCPAGDVCTGGVCLIPPLTCTTAAAQLNDGFNSGTKPDAARWDISGDGTAVVGGGVLTETAPAKTTDTHEVVSSKKSLTGDFSVAADLVTLTPTKKADTTTQELDIIVDGNNQAHIARRKGATTDILETNVYVKGTWLGSVTASSSGLTSVPVKITRQGSQFTVEYKKTAAGAYATLATFANGFSSDVQIGLQTFSIDTHPGATAKFDNVAFTCPPALAVAAAATATPSATLLAASTLTPTPTPSAAQCNSTCLTDADCPSTLICSAGNCRASACTIQTSCVCPAATSSPTPTASATAAPTATLLAVNTSQVTNPSTSSGKLVTGSTSETITLLTLGFLFIALGGIALVM
jgi:hypothetical protein